MGYQLEWTYNNTTCVATGEIIDRDITNRTLIVTFTDLVLSGVWPDNGTITKAKAAMPVRDPKTSLLIRSNDVIKNIDVSALDTSEVSDMYGMFEDCTYLESLDISSLDVSKVTTMESMFRDCTYLKNVTLPSLSTSKLNNMDEMFHNCTSLISLDFSDWNTSKVTAMRFAFANCSANIYLPVSSSLTLYDNIHYGAGNLYIFGDNKKVAEICGVYPIDVFPITYPIINSCSIVRADDDINKVVFSIECTTTFNKKNTLDSLIIIKSPNETQTCEYTMTTEVIDDTTKYFISGYINEELPGAKAGEYSVYITDTLDRMSNVFKVVVPTDATVISVKENSGIAFGETCEDDGFTCSFDAKFKGSIQQIYDGSTTLLVDSDGNVRSGGDIYAHCESDSSGGISLSSITSGTGSFTATKGTITEVKWSMCGYVATVEATFKTTGSIAAGSDMCTGTFTNIPKPTNSARGAGAYSKSPLIFGFGNTGVYFARNCGTTTISSGITAKGVLIYMTDGTML